MKTGHSLSDYLGNITVKQDLDELSYSYLLQLGNFIANCLSCTHNPPKYPDLSYHECNPTKNKPTDLQEHRKF